MSKLHIVKCDACKTNADLKWNGEHHLIPEGWVECFNHDVRSQGHLCPTCFGAMVGQKAEKQAKKKKRTIPNGPRP